MSPFRDTGRLPPQCACGHDRAHPMVSPSPEYSVIGWFFILLGVSWDPIAIDFVCRRCDERIERIVDPAAMKRVRVAG